MIRKVFASLTLVVMLMATASYIHAAGCASCDDGCSACCNDGSGCCNGGDVCCPECQLKVEKIDVDKHCWKVECKKICVPRFVFPWQKSCCDPCANNGACTREVLVLKKHKYTCPDCKYSWSPLDDTCDCDKGCCSSCDGGCSNGCGCASGAMIEGTIIESPSNQAPTVADPAVDIPPAPPAPSAAVRNPSKVRMTASRKATPAKRTNPLTTALRKLRK